MLEESSLRTRVRGQCTRELVCDAGDPVPASKHRYSSPQRTHAAWNTVFSRLHSISRILRTAALDLLH